MAIARLEAVLDTQRPNLALWIPVLFATGIGIYFAVPAEPQGWVLAALGALLAMGLATLLRAGPLVRLALLIALLPMAGFAAGALRSLAVAAPVLPQEMTVNVEGRLVGLDRSGSDRPRLLLDRVVIHGLFSARTPKRVRLSVDPDTDPAVLEPGARLLIYARLSPPASPAEPGGFDFRRMAWFKGIGGVGYAIGPAIEAGMDEARAGIGLRLFKARLALSRSAQAAIPGRNGGFAAAILTGDRSAVEPGAVDALRASNLAHLLAISGLHMGLLSGFVFVLVRAGLALVPPLALRLPGKKIAAGVALGAGFVYLALSGANVATQRAFIMTAVVLVAVLIDRPAFTLRSVGLAAMVVLLIRPESLTEAGFQMSFAATTALIAVFEALRRQAWWRATYGDAWRFVRPVIGIAVTSTVAGLATAPISAFHFNTLSQYGLAANVLAVPAMGLVVMPAAVIAGLLAPLGLAALPLAAADLGIGYILAVAEFVAGREGAVRAIPAGPAASLVLIALGGLVLVLVVGRVRLAGLVPIALAIALWVSADRPDILVAENGRLFGVRSPEGRVLNSARGNGFVAASWLENDGDGADQEIAAARAGMERQRGRAEIAVPGLGPVVYIGSRRPDAATRDLCAGAAEILLAPRWLSPPDGDCLFIGAVRLAQDGALALNVRDEGIEIEGARSRNRARPWTRGGDQE